MSASVDIMSEDTDYEKALRETQTLRTCCL